MRIVSAPAVTARAQKNVLLTTLLCWGSVDSGPTNRRFMQRDHLTLGRGRGFSEVAPLRGVVIDGGKQGLKVRLIVTPGSLAGGR